MRTDDLHHKELLELDPEGGVIRFARQGPEGRRQEAGLTTPAPRVASLIDRASI